MKMARNILLIILIILLTTNNSATAQQSSDVISRWVHFSDAPNALYHHIAAEAYGLLDARTKKISTLHSPQDWQQRRQWIRNTLTDMVGPFPERTPLHARITRVIKKDDYQVQHIIYESQPGFYVTSSLYLPNGAEKAPAIIYCSGHSDSGYRAGAYQHVILNLVKKGFIVFAFDPVGQGERLEYYDPAKGRSPHRWPTTEHSYPGAQLFITGASLARYMIWDGIRAVDYLRSRKEVDTGRIGITGRSGGGTQSACIAAFDERISAAAPENYITGFTRLFQTIGPQDAEQDLFNGIARGIDIPDLLLARVPMPALMITTTRDIFPIQGAMEAAKEVSAAYEADGKAGHFSMVTDDAVHVSTRKNREALYAFFQQHLHNPGSPQDEETRSLSREELRVTETGQIATSVKNTATLFSLNKQEAEKKYTRLQASRQRFADLLDTARKLSGYREPGEVPAPVFTGRTQKQGYVIEKGYIKGEGDYVIPYLLLKPDTPAHKALIYLSPSGKSLALPESNEMEWFVRNGFTVLAPDLVGTGEMGPGVFKGDSYIDSCSYNLWFASLLTGRSIAGIQSGDVNRLVQLLRKHEQAGEVSCLARKEMSPVLLHAAAFNPGIRRIALIAPYASYRSVVMSRFYRPAFIQSTVPGALKGYDLPDLAASLAPRKLLMVGVTDGNGNSAGNISEDMSVIRAAYQHRNALGQLLIIPPAPDGKLSDSYRNWIND